MSKRPLSQIQLVGYYRYSVVTGVTLGWASVPE